MTATPNAGPANHGHDPRITVVVRRGPRVPLDFTNAHPLYEELLRLAESNRRSFTAECLVRLERSVQREESTPEPAGLAAALGDDWQRAQEDTSNDATRPRRR